MKRICTGVATAAGTVLLAGVSYDLANEPKGEGPADYSGASSGLHLRQCIATGRDSGHTKASCSNRSCRTVRKSGSLSTIQDVRMSSLETHRRLFMR
jgi:hypothetical protein